MKDLLKIAVWTLAGASVGALVLGLIIAGVHRVVGKKDSVPKASGENTQSIPALLLWVRARLPDGSLRLALKAAPAAVLLAGWFGLQLVSRTPRADSVVTPVSNPGNPVVLDASIGRPAAAMGQVTIRLESVDPAGDSFEAGVKVDDEPEVVIKGIGGSKFRDRGNRVEIQAADLGQGSVRFKVWSVQH
jgi:hypothetical protein